MTQTDEARIDDTGTGADARVALHALPAEATEFALDRLVLRPMTEHEVSSERGRRGIDSRHYWEVRDRDQASGRRPRRFSTGVQHDGDELILSVELRDSAGGPARIIGGMSVYVLSSVEATLEVGWALHPAAHGHGYAKEAVAGLLRVCFDTLGAHRVTAQLDARNETSARLCAESGMRQEGRFVADQLLGGEWTDTVSFALLAEEHAATGATVAT